MFSPYAAMGNAPESTIDPNGEMFQPAKGATSFYAANDKLYRGDEGGPGSSGGGGSGTGGDAIWAALSAFGLEGSANIMEYAAKKQQEAMTGAENNQDQAPVANGEGTQSGGNETNETPKNPSSNNSGEEGSGDSEEEGQTWYYMWRVNGKAHAMVYDPVTKTVYEINSPKDENGEDIPTWKSAVSGDPLSFAYKYSRNNKEEWKNLAKREAGKTFALCPINVPDPTAARDWFNANTGHTWWYALGAQNCSIYVFKGLRAGGADIHHVYSPAPSSINSTPTMYWYFPELP